MPAIELTQEQLNELHMLKQFYPYRLYYAAFNPRTEDYRVFAVHSRPTRKIKALVAKGYTVFQAT